MHNVKAIIRIKICLLVAGAVLAGTMLLFPSSPVSREETTVIIIDMHTGMLVQDIATSKGDLITRLDAAKKIITQLVLKYPQRLFGLVTYGQDINYLIPPTLDSGNLLQYVNGLLVAQNGNVEILPTDRQAWKHGNVSERSTGLVESLKGKDLLIIGDIVLPQSLASHVQNIGLGTTIHSLSNLDTIIKNFNASTFPPFNLSTFQFQRLVGLLCLMTILAL
ncbi:MAG: VWA domain-containing protein [Candidatus Absconditabacterales bacterium]